MRTTSFCTLAVCVLLLLAPVHAAASQPAAGAETAPRNQRSPFHEVRFRDDRALVLVDRRWYLLEGIAGDGWSLQWPELRAAAETAFDSSWRQRIAMDLDAVLEAAGRRAGGTLTIMGRALDDPDRDEPAAEVTTLPGVAHTQAKRNAARDAFRAAESRLEAAALRELVEPAPALNGVVAAIRDLHAQGMRCGVDWDVALSAQLARLGDGAPASEVIRAAQRLVALTGDGHAEVAQFDRTIGKDTLPLALVRLGGEWRGYARGTDSPSPWIWPAGAADVRIDGVPVDRWVGAATPFVAAGAEHLVRRRSARLAQRTGFIREQLGLAKSAHEPVDLTWTDPDGAPVSRQLPLSRGTVRPRPPESVTVDDETDIGSARLRGPGGGAVALVRIASMGSGDAFAAALHAAMRSALDADALVIDVRGNTGGDRDALLIVLPYLMQPEALVFNVARPRLRICGVDGPGAGLDGLLTDRYLRPHDWAGWSAPERAVIDRALAGFTPSWSPPEGWEGAGFGPWYFGVVTRSEGPHAPTPETVRATLPFKGPVAVLLDERCFSATDIFLGAIEQLPAVTLVGTPSSGGSARAVVTRIEGPPRLTVRLASIASFRPDGRAYDGAGIEPDIAVEPAPEDYEGRGDRVLDEALRSLSGRVTPR